NPKVWQFTVFLADGSRKDVNINYVDSSHRNVWLHLALVSNGLTSTAYINNVAGTPTGLTGSALQPGEELLVGGYRAKTGYPVTRFWLGSIDEVRIFGRALSPEDVGTLHNKRGLKRGEQVNWYSINDPPHLVE